MVKTVILFANGNSAVLDEGGTQIPDLQSPWLLLFVEHLKKNGVDYHGVNFLLPDEIEAEIFPTKEGLNWEITRK